MAQSKTVFITAHVGPDGDTLGSMLGLKHAFAKACPQIQRVDCVIAGKMPAVYHFLPGIDTVQNIEADPDLLDRYDLAISVDCGSLDRLGPAGALFQAATTSVNIDHHISNERFATLNIVEPQASSSGEVVAGLLDGMAIPLDANIATCLYAAMITDTGGFKYSNTSEAVFQLAARLVKAGANPELIFKEVYEIRPLSQVRLQAEALLQTQFNPAETLGWTTVTRQMLERYGARDEHIDGVVESIRQVETVLVAAVFNETPSGETKVSLRSDDHRLDVSAVMVGFGGGGHKMAAGCTIPHPPEKARELLLPQLEALVVSVGPVPAARR